MADWGGAPDSSEFKGLERRTPQSDPIGAQGVSAPVANPPDPHPQKESAAPTGIGSGTVGRSADGEIYHPFASPAILRAREAFDALAADEQRAFADRLFLQLGGRPPLPPLDTIAGEAAWWAAFTGKATLAVYRRAIDARLAEGQNAAAAARRALADAWRAASPADRRAFLLRVTEGASR